jgi:molybdenum cofactor cytidylyltransferase
VPTYEGVRGNPVLLSARLAPEIAHLSGDMGARQILRGRDDVCDLPVTSAAARLDIDTPEALKKL